MRLRTVTTWSSDEEREEDLRVKLSKVQCFFLPVVSVYLVAIVGVLPLNGLRKVEPSNSRNWRLDLLT